MILPWCLFMQSEPATTLATGLLTRVQEIDGQSDSGTARRNWGMSVAVGAPGKLKAGLRPRAGPEGEGSPGGRKTTPGSDRILHQLDPVYYLLKDSSMSLWACR
jgi:hypothetical protein